MIDLGVRLRIPGAVVAFAMLLGAIAPGAGLAQDLPQTPVCRTEMVATTKDLSEALERGDVAVLHVARDREHYDAGHVPGAVFVPWGELTATRGGVPNELPTVDALVELFTRLGVGDTCRIILYGDSAGLSAARAFFTLDYLGHGQRAALLDGGLEKWVSEGRPVSREPVTPSPSPFFARLRPELVVGHQTMRDLAWVAAHQKPSDVVLIDARPPDEFTGRVPGDGIPRPGHIPGATNVYWMRHLATKENPVLLPERELRKLYTAAGVEPGKKIVTYCRTGGQASHAYFVLKFLGYDVAMYDGSFFEWSNAPQAPVAAGGT